MFYEIVYKTHASVDPFVLHGDCAWRPFSRTARFIFFKAEWGRNMLNVLGMLEITVFVPCLVNAGAFDCVLSNQVKLPSELPD